MNPAIGLAAAVLAGALALAAPAQAQPQGPACGGPNHLQCPAGQFCNTSGAACHKPEAAGVCETPPQLCNEIYQPVCGCDGKTYPNACHAEMKGVSVAASGACAPPAPAPSNH